jgi:NAD(P)H-nitrite reductase large subunit
MAVRHLIIGGGTAGIHAIRTIREEEAEPSAITLVSAERPYSRMVLPYYLDGSIAEAHVYTATAAVLAQWGVTSYLGRRVVRLDPAARTCTLDDGTTLEYDDCLIATGSSPVRAPVEGADGPGVHAFWTLAQCRDLLASLRPGAHVVVVGAGFIAFTILNALLRRGARLTVVEIAPQVLPRMIDGAAARVVEAWLRRHQIALRTDTRLTAIRDVRGRKRLSFARGGDLTADVVIMATGIRPNLEWLDGAGVRIHQGILVDHHLRASVTGLYAAGDVAEGPERVTGRPVVHALEPTAQEHGRVAGANMAGREVRYRGSLAMNIVEVCHLDIASFGVWDDPVAEAVTAALPDRSVYRKYLWTGDRLTGAILVGPSHEVWTTNDLGMLKGLVQAQVPLGRFKDYLRQNPFDVKTAYLAARAAGALLPETLLGRPAKAPGATPVAV